MASRTWVRRPKSKKRQSPIYAYQKNNQYFAQIEDGLKELGAKELSELGAENVQPDFSGIHFKADKSALYRINYMTRLSSRCLAPLVSFPCHDDEALYKHARQVAWMDFFFEDNTFAISGNVSNSKITHSKYATLRLKDAIIDYFRSTTGQRPNISVKNPDVQLNLHINRDKAVISLDTSGGPLHQRGYREEAVSAPMQETLAAAIIRFSEWDGSVPLYDPMCGSGTLLCEALMHYSRIPAGIFRKRFGFEALPDFDPTIWQQVKAEAESHIRELPDGLIAGSDIAQESVRAVKTNLMGLHFGNSVHIEKADFRNLPFFENHTIVANPPYGIRMGKDKDLEIFHKDLGDFLKQKCKGSNVYIYFGERKYIRNIGLKPSWKKSIRAGGLDGRLVKYEIY